jgi:hypothetical protein
MVSPRVYIEPRYVPLSPLYCIGKVDRKGKRFRLAPMYDNLPHIVCFETPHAASEVCRVVNFDTRRLEIENVLNCQIEDFLTLMITSHEELAAEGWKNYGMDLCSLDTQTWRLKVESSVVHHHETIRWEIPKLGQA